MPTSCRETTRRMGAGGRGELWRGAWWRGGALPSRANTRVGVEGRGSTRVPPHAVVIETSWPAASLREESPAHPLLLLYRQRPSPAQGQHLKHTANQTVSVMA